MNEKNRQMVEEWAESGWYPAISAAAERLTELCPKIVFDQIKSKFGGLRFYYTIPMDLDLSDMPAYVRGSRERLEQYAGEITIWATGWVEGYESNVKELRQRELHHFETEQENASLMERVEELQDAIRSLEAGADEY